MTWKLYVEHKLKPPVRFYEIQAPSEQGKQTRWHATELITWRLCLWSSANKSRNGAQWCGDAPR